MKKFLFTGLVLLMLLTVVACAAPASETKEPAIATEAEPTPEPTPALSEVEVAAIAVVQSLKDSLNNPQSFQLHQIAAQTFSDDIAADVPEAEQRLYEGCKDFAYIFEIDFSGENKLGGTARETKSITVTKNGEVYETKLNEGIPLDIEMTWFKRVEFDADMIYAALA